MSSYKKEMKKIENQQKAQEQLNVLTTSLNNIKKMIDDFYADAKECLDNNDETGFELIANSIFYFQDVQKVISNVKVQFQTYVKTSEFIGNMEGIRPVLKQTAKMMNSMPSFNKNNKDFMKFRKGLLRGQLNMKAMSSMMTTINPALTTGRSKNEFDTLKERLTVGTNSNLNLGGQTIASTATSSATTSVSHENDDFFSAINAD